MTAEDRELGRLVGVVDQLVERIAGLDRAVRDLRESNAREHAQVKELLANKADAVDVIAQAERVDDLEADRDRRAGMAQLVGLGRGAAVLLIAVLTYFASTH